MNSPLKYNINYFINSNALSRTAAPFIVPYNLISITSTGTLPFTKASTCGFWNLTCGPSKTISTVSTTLEHSETGKAFMFI